MLTSIESILNSQKNTADIGRTNARFAILNSDGSIQDQMVLKGKEHDGFVSAFQEKLGCSTVELQQYLRLKRAAENQKLRSDYDD